VWRRRRRRREGLAQGRRRWRRRCPIAAQNVLRVCRTPGAAIDLSELSDLLGKGRVLRFGHQFDHLLAGSKQVRAAANERAQSLDRLVGQAVARKHLRLDDERLDLALFARGSRRERRRVKSPQSRPRLTT